MRASTKVAIVVLAIAALVGIGRAAEGARKDRTAFEQAQLADTIDGYEQFISAYPRSGFVEQAQKRLNFLKERRKAGLARLARLQGYQVGQTTLADFEADGWSTEDAFYGLTGILSAEASEGSLRYALGTVEFPGPRRRMAELAEGSYRRAMSRLKTYMEGSSMVFAVDPSLSTKEVCKIKFTNGILVNVEFAKVAAEDRAQRD